MFMENLPKEGPLSRKLWAQKPTHMGGTYPYPQHVIYPPPGCQAWKEKTLHGQSLRQTENEASIDRWNWLRNTGIKRGTESMIMATQEQAIRTNVIKAKIDKTQEESKCRMCGQVPAPALQYFL